MAERTEELRVEIDRTRDHMSGTVDAIGDRVLPGRIVERRVGMARRSVSRFGERIMGTPRAAASAVQSTAGDAASSASSTASDAADAAKQVPQRVEEATAGHPLVAGAVAFGLGVVLGSLAPPTRAEEDVVGELVEPVRRDVAQMGHDVAATVADEARTDARDLQESAAEAASAVKDHAASAADEVRGTATDAGGRAADQVRNAAQPGTSGRP